MRRGEGAYMRACHACLYVYVHNSNRVLIIYNDIAILLN